MAVPRKKISKSKRRSRHGQWQRVNLKRMANKYNIVTCSNCGAKKLSHRVCPTCWYYKWKQVITIKVKDKSVVVDA